MKLPVIAFEQATPARFVQFWSSGWTDKDRKLDQDYYNCNIGKDLTSDRLLALFEWKNQMPLSNGKRRMVEGYASQLKRFAELSPDTEPDAFFNEFRKGRAIWRIFLFHCWSAWRGQKKYPIYDQHVHRAMNFIKGEHLEEIGNWSDQDKISSYVRRYVSFFESFKECDAQQADQSLMVFGRFVRDYKNLATLDG
jgi:hypothetical protein